MVIICNQTRKGSHTHASTDRWNIPMAHELMSRRSDCRLPQKEKVTAKQQLYVLQSNCGSRQFPELCSCTMASGPNKSQALVKDDQEAISLCLFRNQFLPAVFRLCTTYKCNSVRFLPRELQCKEIFAMFGVLFSLASL